MAGGVNRRGASMAGGIHGRGTCMAGGHAWSGGLYVAGEHAWQGACVAGETAIAAGGTHPTGMHSCSFNLFLPTRCVRIPFS